MTPKQLDKLASDLGRWSESHCDEGRVRDAVAEIIHLIDEEIEERGGAGGMSNAEFERLKKSLAAGARDRHKARYA